MKTLLKINNTQAKMKTLLKMNSTRTALLISALTLIVTLSLASVNVFAETYTNSDTGYSAVIDDTADIMTDKEEQDLLESMKNVTEYGNAYCYTTDAKVTDTYHYAASQYERIFGRDAGSIFVIAMGSRQLYLYNQGSFKTVIPDAASNTIVDRHYSLASASEYAQCAQEVFSDVYNTMSGQTLYLLYQPLRVITVVLLAFLISFLINYFMIAHDRSMPKNVSVSTQYGRNLGGLRAAILSYTITKRKKFSRGEDVSSGAGNYSGGGSFSGGGGFSGGGFSGGGGSGGGHGF